MSQPFRETMPLHEARSVLREMVDEGHACPLCTLFVKVYRHKLDSAMARTIIRMYRAVHLYEADGTSAALHIPSLPGDNHKVSQLSWWGLVREEKINRPDGGRGGYWRLTAEGVEFVLGTRTIPKYARIFDARVLGFVGEQVTVQDCLGNRFNYTELMNA